jgi:hypothetical protein
MEAVMRLFLTLLVVAAAPGAARAAPELRLAVLGDAQARSAPAARLAVPELSVRGLEALRVDDGAGARGPTTAEPALALILGIIPGFGIGHLVANSPRWTTWLVVDLALVAVWVVGSALDAGDPLGTLFLVAVVVERVFEGIDAFRAAGGRLAMRDGAGPPAWALARPVGDSAALARTALAR